ncbi:hypothetical protein Dhaf_3567 [Desulfitobacterium hafniense DCB-2]|uniref:Prokaryotic membrane lipoprotein lipid attachment site profile n=1 Tax=Desulfitobacterium hafniense (strain DSM 10664 / DCB-2) TaxID=272564 RepID=B8FQC4_DESHD|nr:hypothetical protein [Desulfitobacterium hafniense]ACL21585.1 hypothetical protein Dhaf_3567 [Desulfitobacterium hafniense DCB-2]
MNYKKYTLFLILSIFVAFISGCNKHTNEIEPVSVTESHYYSLMHSVFNFEYHNKLWEYQNVVEHALKAKTALDLSYLHGLLEGYTYDNAQIILLINSTNKPNMPQTFDKIVVTELQESAVTVIVELNEYLKNLVKETEEIESLKSRHEELMTISELLDEISYIELDKATKDQIEIYKVNSQKIMDIIN